MAKKTSVESVNIAKNLYQSGVSMKECSSKIGIHEETLRRLFKEVGVKTRKTSTGIKPKNKNESIPEIDVIILYKSGVSENSISKEYKVSRNVIRRILNSNNVYRRNQSESEKMKWSFMNNEERINQYKSAHDACKGRVRTQDELNKMAISRELNFAEHFVGIGEIEFKEYLIKNNIDFSYQKACMSYNMDFLINNVCLELTSCIGRNIKSNEYTKRRAREIYSKGYKTLYVEFVNIEKLILNLDLIIQTINKIKKDDFKDSHYFLLRILKNTNSFKDMG